MKTFEQIYGNPPLVVESFRHVTYNDKVYKRRLRISGLAAVIIDEQIGTNIYGQRCKFVVLDEPDVEMACRVLGIEHKNVSTYFHIDSQMCSLKFS